MSMKIIGTIGWDMLDPLMRSKLMKTILEEREWYDDGRLAIEELADRFGTTITEVARWVTGLGYQLQTVERMYIRMEDA